MDTEDARTASDTRSPARPGARPVEAADLPGHWVDRAALSPDARPAPVPRPWLEDAVAVAEALFLRDDGPPPRAHLDWLARELDDHLARVGLRSRLVFRASLSLLARLVPLLARRLGRLSSIPVSARADGLARLERSPLSLNVLAVKAMLCILWYEHPEEARRIGLTPGRPVRASAARPS